MQFLGLREEFVLTAANKSVRKPRSAANWTELCYDHPEFFEVLPESGTVYLSIRYHIGELRKREAGHGDDDLDV